MKAVLTSALGRFGYHGAEGPTVKHSKLVINRDRIGTNV